MFENEVRRLPVIQHGQLAGIITLGDIQRALPPRWGREKRRRPRVSTLTVVDVMSPDPITVAPGDTIQEAAEQMLENQVGACPSSRMGAWSAS